MKFFAIGLSAQKLSVNEFKHLIDGKHNYRQVIDDWIQQGKYISSIEYNLTIIKAHSLSKAELSDYLNGALYYALQKQGWRNKNLKFLNIILAKRNFHDDKVAHDIVKEWIQEQIKDVNHLLPLSSILKSLYATKEYDSEHPNEFTIHHKVLSNKEIETMLSIVAKTYVEKNRLKVNPLDMLKRGTELFNLFHNCCVETECVPIDGLSHYIQTSFDGIIQLFNDSNSKPTIEEYQSCLTELYYEPEPDPNSFEDPNEYYQWQEYNSERYVQQMSSHFGSGYEKMLKEFKSKCFQPAPISDSEADTPKEATLKKKATILHPAKVRNKRKRR